MYRRNRPKRNFCGQLVFQVRGDTAQWCAPQHPLSRVTLAIPPPSQIQGLFYERFHHSTVFPVPVQVELLKPLKQLRMPQLRHRSSAVGASDPKMGENSGALVEPRSSLYLADVEYRFHVDLLAVDERRFRKATTAITAGGGLPYLGVRECLAWHIPVDNKPPAPVNTIEPYLPIGSRYASVEVINGVAVYPSWTKEALEEWAGQRHEVWSCSQR